MRREGVGFPLSDSVGEDGCMTEHNVGADNQKTSLTVLRRSHWARNSLAQADDLQSPIMLLFAVLAVLAVLAVYVYSLQPGKNDPPGPFRLPLLGVMHKLGNNPHMSMHELSKQYGPVISGVFGWRVKFMVLHDADIIDSVFVQQGQAINSRLNMHLGAVFSGEYDDAKIDSFTTTDALGILNSDGTRWRANRKLAFSKLFTKERVRQLSPLIDGELDALLHHIDEKAKAGALVEPTEVIPEFTMNVICKLAFGIRVNNFGKGSTDVEKKISELVRFTFYYLSPEKRFERMFKILRVYSPWTEWGKFKSSLSELRSFLEGILNEREEILAQSPGELPSDFNILDLLLLTRKQDTEYAEVENRDIVTMMLDFLLAGTDTSANTLAFAIAQLANHQEIQKKLIDEIHSVVGRDRHPTHEDLARMPYLEAVFHETLRRHTVVPWGLGHVVVEDIQVGQYHVPADPHTLVFASIWSVHMNEKYWGDPLNYRPERWIEKPDLKKAKFFIPFASGPRVCVGRNLATVEARMALAAIFQRFKVLPPTDDAPVEWTEHNHITMSPSSYKVRFVQL